MATNPEDAQAGGNVLWLPVSAQDFGSAQWSRGATSSKTGGTPPSGGEPDMSTRLDRLEHHRTWLWRVLAGAISLATAAIVGSFFILDDRIQDRFDVADDRNREISKDISEIKTDIAVQNRGIEELLNRDKQPEGSVKGR